ncbi:hypothetical protein U879_04615 [Defluviimonas sp. 20V17]|uniref:Uncharacterized protein n=1 Tax=Allgaiera indica TaxID=765699 RepID=A0AAN4UUP4_9RHOB|nr:hypothetical protein [Allgaiera indica]KDB04859.1 hypothetical protein U879_04615 [Defluviimonas sp. 20V17]GHE05810.1 hypothetical protein GCM10008024_37970 [Allgaiera indica]SDX79808.1 hypothetical protein SAMN05444006_13033 [Allgaiera indica]
MKALYERTFDWMDRQHQALCRSIPPPQRIDQKGLTTFRFVEKRPDQAMIQQLARVISGLRATFLLLEQGLFQEQIALCRMLHDIEEDVTFLAHASRQHPAPRLLTDYLDAFFAEEIALESLEEGQRVKGRSAPSRRKIINYLASYVGTGDNPFEVSNNALAIHFTLSGYVHAASSQVMEMYDPESSFFVTAPSPNNPFRKDHEHDMWNYVYRGVLSFLRVAATIGNEDARRECALFLKEFKRLSGDRVDF